MLTYKKLESPEHGWCLSNMDDKLRAENLTATDLVIKDRGEGDLQFMYIMLLQDQMFF